MWVEASFSCESRWGGEGCCVGVAGMWLIIMGKILFVFVMVSPIVGSEHFQGFMSVTLATGLLSY